MIFEFKMIRRDLQSDLFDRNIETVNDMAVSLNYQLSNMFDVTNQSNNQDCSTEEKSPYNKYWSIYRSNNSGRSIYSETNSTWKTSVHYTVSDMAINNFVSYRITKDLFYKYNNIMFVQLYGSGINGYYHDFTIGNGTIFNSLTSEE